MPVNGRIRRISGPLVVAEGMRGSRVYEVVEVGEERLIGEIIGVEGDNAIIQVYEDTVGLKVGDPVYGTGLPLAAELGPGLIGAIYDGIQRPLPVLQELVGIFVAKGVRAKPLPRDKKWHFKPLARKGDKLGPGDFLGVVEETESVKHYIMVPPGVHGELHEIVGEGDYTVDDTVAVVGEHNVSMIQKWPVRKPRPYREKMEPREPLITGQRVIDYFFPLARGGKAAIPGGFGTGKCVLPGTPVLLGDWRLVPIEKLFEEAGGSRDPGLQEETIISVEDKDIYVYAFDGKRFVKKKVTHVYRGYTDTIVRITTAAGRTIEVTPIHRLPVYDPVNGIVFREAAALAPGDKLVVPRRLPGPRIDPVFPLDKLAELLPTALSLDQYINRKVATILRRLGPRELSALAGKPITEPPPSNPGPLPLRLVLAVSSKYGLGKPGVIGLPGYPAIRVPPRIDPGLAELLGIISTSGRIVESGNIVVEGARRVVERFLSLSSTVFGVEARLCRRGKQWCAVIDNPAAAAALEAVFDGEEGVETRIPAIVLAASAKTIAAFLRGYCLAGCRGDGDALVIEAYGENTVSLISYMLVRLGVNYRVSGNRIMVEGGETVFFKKIISGAAAHEAYSESLIAEAAAPGLLSATSMLLRDTGDIVFDEILEVSVIQEKTPVYDVTVEEHHNFVGGRIPAVYHNTVTLQQLTKWSEVDIAIYVGCGERGNEMADALHSFRRLVDPRTGKYLVERSVFIANTSNMPVAARETSIFLGVTIGEYFRDMGYNVLMVADSTSRWAEAMREISGRLEELPGEEGYPAYLGSRLASFYERSGHVKTLGVPERTGSLTIMGAVSPPGADFSEPVTQATLRIVRALYALDVNLAYRRHYPAINWLTSYSLYVDLVEEWWKKHIDPEWRDNREKAMGILQKEAELEELVRLVGAEALPEEDKLTLEAARMIREDFLQQNAFHEIDTYCPPRKAALMMKAIILFYELGLKAIRKGVTVDQIRKLKSRVSIARMKEIPNVDYEDQFNQLFNEIKMEFDALIKEAENIG